LHKPRLNNAGYTAPNGDKPESTSAAEAFESEYVLSFQEGFRVIRRRLRLIVLVAVMLTGLVAGLSLAQTPTYEANIIILVGQEPGTTQTPVPVGDLNALTQTMTETVDSLTVAEAAIQQLDLQMTPGSLERNLSAERVPDSQLIRVSYTDTSPEQAQQIVNAVGDVFSEQVSRTSASANPISATVWERAEVPGAPVDPNVARNTLIALIAGLLVGTGLAFILEYFSNSWRSPEEVEQVSGVPVFGVIPELKVPKGERMRA
jgi:capsular polysaccharide biosynthesis protein